ncbi:hypothetical protein MRX96_032354 [Rhipicephalus microplus]
MLSSSLKMFGSPSNQAASQSSNVTAAQGNTITRVVDFRRLGEASQRTTNVEALTTALVTIIGYLCVTALVAVLLILLVFSQFSGRSPDSQRTGHGFLRG